MSKSYALLCYQVLALLCACIMFMCIKFTFKSKFNINYNIIYVMPPFVFSTSLLTMSLGQWGLGFSTVAHVRVQCSCTNLLL